MVSLKRSLALAVSLMATGAVAVRASGDLKFDVRPLVKSGTTLVQMRPLFEYLGARVVWNAQTREITATKGAKKILLTLGKRQATVDGKAKTLDVPAQAVSGHTMVPLRFVSEALGTTVEYHGTFISLCSPEGSCTKVDLK